MRPRSIAPTIRMHEPPTGDEFTRRRFLALCGLGVAFGPTFVGGFAARASSSGGVLIGGGHLIQPRDIWGASLQPTGPLTSEAMEDVRFLLVHHSASPNNYSKDRTVQYLRSFYDYHTSAQKGWHDIAYNFLVDRYGQIFEGRKGSIQSPVRGDATGGSQGYALLCSFVGDHSDTPPTTEAQSAMVALLAWLAGTYGIDPGPGATTEFVSRGSNLHPEGKLVTTPTITGHRTMSRTTCPGDQAFALVRDSFPAKVRDALASTPSTISTETTVDPASTSSASTPPTVASTTTPATTEPSTTQVPVQPAPDTTRQPAAADTAPSTTTTTHAASSSLTTVQPATAETNPAPTTSTLPSRETVPGRSMRSLESDDPDSQRGGLLTYWPFAAMSLGMSVLVAVNVIQRRMTNQRPPPPERNAPTGPGDLPR